MRDWNSFEKFSFSLIVSIEDVNAMESKGKPTAGASQGLKKEKAKAGASAEDRAGHLVTHYEAFDEGAHLMQYLKAPDCARYRFKVLVMGDSQYIQEAFPSKNTDPSTAQANDDVQGKGIKWKEYFWFSFLLQRNTQERPYIYFNADLTRMLVQVSGDWSAIIYRRSDIQEKNEVVWVIETRIHRYPIALKGKSSANFLFSPSFDKFIDIDWVKAEFVIKRTSDETVIHRIPHTLLSISFKGRNKSEAAIQAMASRIRFHSETEIQIVTKEGLDCILDFETMKVQSAAGIDNFDVDDFSHPHRLLQQATLEYKNTLQRLMRSCNSIKSMRAHTRDKL